MEYLLGRDHKDPVQIPQDASTVSADHAVITIEGNKWTLIDNNSTNGTYVEQDGQFVRVAKVSITPDTWIRLGNEGVYGFTFKARRVIHPNSFMEDFLGLRKEWEDFKNEEGKLSTMANYSKLFGLMVSIVCIIITLFPPFNKSFAFMRAAMLLPGVASFLLGLWLDNKKRQIMNKRKHIICPKCRRPIGEFDINNGQCSICKAH